jgi:hypothetical protein
VTAEELATRESSRAVALRAELVSYARRVDELEREQRLARAHEPPSRSSNDVGPAPTPAGPAPLPRAALAHSVASAGASSPDTPPVLNDAIEAVAPGVEAIAQLEAEVEYKRQQVAAQLVELRDREQRLRAATTDLASLRAELDESRSNVARLERTLADKDRALEARDARIATLHEELKQRSGAFDKRGSAEVARPSVEAAARPTSHDAAIDSPSTPVLICLTGDAPRRFALTKKTITVGRGPHCELQILTHFVRREHARLTFNGG